jgi:pilus assembly protein CpaF
MSIIARIREMTQAERGAPTPGRGQDKKEDSFNELKGKIHFRLLNLLDLSRLSEAEENVLADDLRRGVELILAEENMALTLPERERLCKEIRDELLGYGPLETLLKDHNINDILVNGFNQVYVERKGKLELTPIRFTDNAHLLKIIEKIASGLGRRVDESCPMVDARLPDGSRVNAIIPPLSLDGPALSILKCSWWPVPSSAGHRSPDFGPGPDAHRVSPWCSG